MPYRPEFFEEARISNHPGGGIEKSGLLRTGGIQANLKTVVATPVRAGRISVIQKKRG